MSPSVVVFCCVALRSVVMRPICRVSNYVAVCHSVSYHVRRYALPLVVALTAFILRWIADATCSPYSSVCRQSSDFLSHIYAVVVIFLLIVGATKAKQVKDVINKVKQAFELLGSSDDTKNKKD
jgi:hypothetical protein